jgi:hypothetical protein
MDRRAWLGLTGSALAGGALAESATPRPVAAAAPALKGDGRSDDAPALQAALDAGGTVSLPAGTYRIGATLVLSVEGATLVGPAAPRNPRGPNFPGAAVLRADAGIDLIRISAGGVRLDSLVLDGGGSGRHGVVLHNGFRARVQSCMVRRFQGDGIRLDTAAGPSTGNNNLAVIDSTICAQNARGIAVPTPQRDNNGLALHNCECGANSSHGILYKGEGLVLIGGIMSHNGGYGIQLSEPGDSGYTRGCLIAHPWVEGNTQGGVYSAGRSVRSLILLGHGIQPHTNAQGSEDVRLLVNSTGHGPFLALSGGLQLGEGSGMLRDTRSAASRWNIKVDPGAVVTTIQALPGARPGDLALASHTGLSVSVGFLLSAYVIRADAVCVSIRNETGHAQSLDGMLRVLTFGIL